MNKQAQRQRAHYIKTMSIQRLAHVPAWLIDGPVRRTDFLEKLLFLIVESLTEVTKTRNIRNTHYLAEQVLKHGTPIILASEAYKNVSVKVYVHLSYVSFPSSGASVCSTLVFLFYAFFCLPIAYVNWRNTYNNLKQWNNISISYDDVSSQATKMAEHISLYETF